MCAVSRVRYPQRQLLRFVTSPEGALVEDITGRLPGHGLYVWPTVDHIVRLLRKQGGGVGPEGPEGVIRRCGEGLSRRFLEGLGLARRAGVIRRGLREVEALLDGGHRPLLILAGDIAAHSRQKFAGVVHRHEVTGWVELLDGDRLGAACGWSHTVILAVNDSGLADRLRIDALRWRTFHSDLL
ncbi:MAG: DUF448 domain-containing protein [Magnetococcales bacterium]|nr:DUF448 domain-containing protein [Magnetococcales bacterium]MBF0149374.1 DUF448 domain-containing protein [Magnetococcales bacterium]MBF0173020.1 DUF448 domain-containing protein [Magnetococcales bacterium]MBF0630917.1 DUF448 domain-containing protein [Magnetococcales bacterium]